MNRRLHLWGKKLMRAAAGDDWVDPVIKARELAVELKRRQAAAQSRNDRLRASALHLCGGDQRAWLFTLMKSGTTFLLNGVLNYAKAKSTSDGAPISAEQLHAFHTFEGRISRGEVASALEVQRAILTPALGLEALIHTHCSIPEPHFSKIICLSRNPLDFCVSSYFFHVKNRGLADSFSEALPGRLDEFCRSFVAQREVLNSCTSAHLLHYEQLIETPHEALSSVLGWLGETPKPELVDRALVNSSLEAVAKMESELGRALVAGAGYQGKSFIRSGKIGEWREHFTDADLDLARRHLAKQDIDLADFQIEPVNP